MNGTESRHKETLSLSEQKTIGTVTIEYPLEIRWHGRGGQGAVTAAKLLAETALEMGMQIQSFPQFGSERRGAPISAFTRIDKKEIVLYNTIQEPNVIIVLDPSLLELPMVLKGLQDDGLLLVNSTLSPVELRSQLKRTGGAIATIPASAIAVKHLKRVVTNTAMLGAFFGATGILPLENVVHHVRIKFEDQFSKEVVEGNIKAIEEAYEKVILG